MNQLTAEQRDRAVAFVLANARPLDRALCRHHFGGGDPPDVLAELGALQNPDGGFHGMEADFQGEASSVLCTLRALEILWEFGGGPDSISTRAVGKLRAVYVPGWRSWPLVPRHDNSAPHGPWWHWSDDFEEGWGFFADNPRPSVVAALHAFSRTRRCGVPQRDHGGRCEPCRRTGAGQRPEGRAGVLHPLCRHPRRPPEPRVSPCWRASPNSSRPRS